VNRNRTAVERLTSRAIVVRVLLLTAFALTSLSASAQETLDR